LETESVNSVLWHREGPGFRVKSRAPAVAVQLIVGDNGALRIGETGTPSCHKEDEAIFVEIIIIVVVVIVVIIIVIFVLMAAFRLVVIVSSLLGQKY